MPVPQWGTLWENFRRDANFPPPGGDVLTGSTTAFLHLYLRMSTVCNIFSTFCFALDRPDQMLTLRDRAREVHGAEELGVLEEGDLRLRHDHRLEVEGRRIAPGDVHLLPRPLFE